MIAQSAGSTRVLVGANAFADAKVALALISRMALDWKVCLGGVLIDDAVSLAICGRPDQRIILASGQLAHAPTQAQVRTLIKADARAFQTTLSRLADAAGTTWTFEQTTGDLVQISLNMAPSWELVVLGYRNIHSVDGKVVLIGTRRTADDRLAEMSQRLCRKLSADRAVFEIDDRIETDRQTTPKPAATDSIQFDTLDEALDRLARTNAQVVLLDMAHGPVRSPKDLRQLIEAARCPVFLFGLPATQLRL